MSKYEAAKYIVKLKARIAHECCVCGNIISPNEYYYKEKLDIQKPPNLILKEFCIQCGEKMNLGSNGGI